MIQLANTPPSNCSWMYFDSGFYLKQCALSGLSVPTGSAEDLLVHYNRFAGRFGLSPNPLFNEKRYARLYPMVERAVKQGHLTSCFEHFNRVGSRQGYSPAWFFDGAWYLTNYDGLTAQQMRFDGYDDAYSHYLGKGLTERRGGNWLTAAVGAARLGAWPNTETKFIETLANAGATCNWLLPIFDPIWWSVKYDANDYGRALERYLEGAREAAFSPSPTFDEAFYRTMYPDVAEGIVAGSFICGYQHFLQIGAEEGRKPFASFDTNFYATRNANVASECAHEGLSPFFHFLKYRKHRLLLTEPPFAERSCDEDSGKTVFERRALILARLQSTTVDYEPHPVVSVIIITRDMFAETMQCIQSVASTTRLPFEVIVYDNGSSDQIKEIPEILPNVIYIRSDRNIGFTTPANRAVERARGKIVLLLNNDVLVAPRAIDRAVDRLSQDLTIGAIGGKIIRTHGLLQEAGSIVWRDGTCLGYGRDLDPIDGSVSFERDVDYCSSCFLALRLEDWRDLEGFDEAYAPAYYEESDLCLRVWRSGKRVVYDPSIVVWHFEFGSSKLREDAIALQRRNQKYFRSRHGSYLAQCYQPTLQNVEVARLRQITGRRILFIEDALETGRAGQGFVRSSYVASTLAKESGLLTMIGMNPPRERERLWPRTPLQSNVEMLRDITHLNLFSFLQSRSGVYDYIWLSRTHNIRFLAQFICENPEWLRATKVVIDTEAIASSRTMHQARLLGVELDRAELLSEEIKGIEIADAVCVVNQVDRQTVADYLQAYDMSDCVHILGHALSVVSPPPPFDEGHAIVITGSFTSYEGPNADATHWFDVNVRPILEDILPGVEYIIAGHKAQAYVDQADFTYSYTVMSDLEDMSMVYRCARLVVAPTRFAGGIPFKVHEAASKGVPVAMTELLARQLGWHDDLALGVASETDPFNFAEMVKALFTQKERWTAAQQRQIELIHSDCDPLDFADRLERILRSCRSNG